MDQYYHHHRIHHCKEQGVPVSLQAMAVEINLGRTVVAKLDEGSRDVTSDPQM